MKRYLRSRKVYWAAAVILALGAGLGSFYTVRTFGGEGSEATAQRFGPFWWAPAFEEDFKKPRLEQQVINGILVGPDSKLAPGSGLCEEIGVQSQYVPFERLDERSAGTPLQISPNLPPGVQLTGGEGLECGGTLVIVAKYYHVLSKDNPAGAPPILWSGGAFSVSRRLSPVHQFPLQGAAERVGPFSIKGRQAVLMRPVMPLGVDAGIGDLKIVIAEDWGITAIEGGGLPLSEFIRIAESLSP